MILSQTVLDHIIFQLTPTRTRFDLYVVSGSVAEKLTSGLLHPFLSHLQSAQEQFATGGYSIQIEPNPNYNKSSWFTKDTVERFVRFVNTPELIERANTIEAELVQLEETIGTQNLDPTRDDMFVADSPASSLHASSLHVSEVNVFTGEKLASLPGNSPFSKMIRREYGSEATPAKNTKDQLLRALNARRSVLQKEQGMAFARASAAGFELCHLMQLIVFSESFQAVRMKEACSKFVTLCQKQHIPGFCSDDILSIDKDLVEAVAKTGCASILNLQREPETHIIGNEVYAESHCHTELKPGFQSVSHDEWKLDDAFRSSEHPFNVEGQFQQKIPVYINSSPATQVCHWSTAREWPNVYTITNNSTPFQAHQCGFSPCSQESFNILSDMSPPPDATAKFYHLMGSHNQLSPDIQTCQNAFEMNYSSPGRREIVGNRNLHHEGTVTGKNSNRNHHSRCKQFTDEESVGDDYDRETSEVTDSSVDISIPPKPGSMTPQPRFNSPEAVIGGSQQKWGDSADLNLSSNWKHYQDHRFNSGKSNHRELTKPGQETPRSFSATGHVSQIKEVDESIMLLRSRRSINCENTVSYTLSLDAEVQNSKRSSTIDNSSLVFGQHTDYMPGIRSKKRLEFQEPETSSCNIKVAKDLMPLDDTPFIHVQRMDQAQDKKKSLFIEAEMQGSKIYDMMSKKALMVNSMANKQKEHDDLIMVPRRQNNSSSTGNGDDVMKIDIDLLKPTHQVQSAKHLSGHYEPSQERVKKFLDQYNEKKEAKLRGNIRNSNRVDREGKVRAMEDMVEKRKVEVNGGKRAERRFHVLESRLHADDIRVYKAASKKSKEEKEDEERKRLEVLKAQRQERIASRRNVNSLIIQGKSTSSPPTSKLSPLKKPLSLVQKARPSSFLGSHSMPSLGFNPKPKEPELNEVRSKTNSRFTRNNIRSSLPSVMDHHHDHPPEQTGISTSLMSGKLSQSVSDKVQFKAEETTHSTKDREMIVSEVSDGQITLDGPMKKSISISNGFKRQSSSILSPNTTVSAVHNIAGKLRVKSSLLDASVKVISIEEGMPDVASKPLKLNGNVNGKGFLKKDSGVSFGAKVLKLTGPRKANTVDTLLIPTLEESNHSNAPKVKIEPDVTEVVQMESFENRMAKPHVGLEVESSASLSELAYVYATKKIQSNDIIMIKERDEKRLLNSIEAPGEGRIKSCLSPSGKTSNTSPQLVLNSFKPVNYELKSSEPKIDEEESQDTNCHKNVEQIDSILWVSEQSKPFISSRSYGGELDYPIKNTFKPVFSFSDSIPMSTSRVREEDHDDLSINQCPSVEDSERRKQNTDSFRNESVDPLMPRLTLFDRTCTQNAETYIEPSVTLSTNTSPIRSLNGSRIKPKSTSESSSFLCATQFSTPVKDHYYKGFKSLLPFRRRSPQSQALKTPTRSEDMERDRVDGGTSFKHSSMSDDKKWHSDSSLSRSGVKTSAKHRQSGSEKSSGSSGKAWRTFSFFGTFLGRGKCHVLGSGN